MNSSVLIGLFGLGCVGYRLYGVWQNEAFDLVPTWQYILWAAIVGVSVMQIARHLRRRR